MKPALLTIEGHRVSIHREGQTKNHCSIVAGLRKAGYIGEHEAFEWVEAEAAVSREKVEGLLGRWSAEARRFCRSQEEGTLVIVGTLNRCIDELRALLPETEL